jgi:hypothetical protein
VAEDAVLVEEIVDDDDVLDINSDEEILPVTYEITSYGADYPVDGLIRRLNDGDVVIPSFDPEFAGDDEVRGFQRRFVWTRPQMDRFIESLLLGLPVPGVFLVKDQKNRQLVLDGQQRLRTLQAYYRGIHAGREYKLRYVQKIFRDLAYSELDPEDRRRLNDSIIHATVLRQESPAGTQDAIYTIFERLNTGGSTLQPQEIRVALYNGPFMALIARLNDDLNWRALYGPLSSRFKDQELILRVLALYEEPAAYTRPVKGYLNHYLERHQMRGAAEAGSSPTRFREAARLINEAIGTRAFRPVRPLNAAVLDSVTVAVMSRLDRGAITDLGAFVAAYDSLVAKTEYLAATTSSTAAEESVRERLTLAAEAFQAVP